MCQQNTCGNCNSNKPTEHQYNPGPPLRLLIETDDSIYSCNLPHRDLRVVIIEQFKTDKVVKEPPKPIYNIWGKQKGFTKGVYEDVRVLSHYDFEIRFTTPFAEYDEKNNFVPKVCNIKSLDLAKEYVRKIHDALIDYNTSSAIISANSK